MDYTNIPTIARQYTYGNYLLGILDTSWDIINKRAETNPSMCSL